MSDALWDRLGVVFERALLIPEPQRLGFLHKSGLSPELCCELESLLGAAERGQRLDSSVSIRHPPEHDDVAPGCSLGPYRVKQLIGRGGMADVYLAERCDGKFDQLVAAKVMKSGAAAERFRVERNVLAQLQHPSIPRLLDSGQTADGRPYILMEYINGVALTEYCERGALSLRERLMLFIQLCAALEYAHSNLIVHRDLKSSNILVTPEGHIKLLDFGVAKQLGAPMFDQAALTLLAGAPVTPTHAAPEQLNGGAITTATDVYGLGAVLFELLTGGSPWMHLRDVPLARAVRCLLQDVPKSCSAVAEDRASTQIPAKALRGDLDAVVARALEKRPADRYRSVEALREDIVRFLRHEPVAARRATIAYRAGKLLRRQGGPIVAATALLVVLAGFVWTIAYERDRALIAEGKAKEEAVAAQQVARYLTSLFQAASPAHARGKPLVARDLVDAGVERIEQELKGQPLLRARMQATLAGLYCELGSSRQCANLLEKALNTITAQPAVDPLVRGRIVARLGDALFALGDFRGAEARYRDAIEQSRTFGEGKAFRDEVQISLALALRETGQIREAIEMLEELIGRGEAGRQSDCESCARVLHILGPAYMQAGRRLDAEQALRRSVQITRDKFGVLHPDYASRLHSLGALLRKSDSTASEMTLREALQIKRRLYGPESDRLSNTLSELASVIKDQGRTREALSYMKQAIPIAEAQFGIDSMEYAMLLHNLGVLLMEVGEFDEARPPLERADRIARSRSPGTTRAHIFRTSLGRLLGCVGRLEEALLTLSEDVPGELEGDEAKVLRGRLLRHRADLYRERGEWDRAWRLYDESAHVSKEVLAPEDLFFASLHGRRGQLQAARGHYQEALPLLAEALSLHEVRLASSAPSVLDLKVSLAEVLMELGRLQESADLVRQIQGPVAAELATSHPARRRLEKVARGLGL